MSASLEQKQKWFAVLRPYTVLTALVASLIVFLLVYPVGRMLFRVVFGEGKDGLAEAASVFSQPWFLPVLGNTAFLVATSTALAVIVGALLAWINERTDAGLGALGTLIPIIPLLIPNVALAIGWAFIAAPRVGFLNGVLAHLPDFLGPIQVNIYSWAGLIFIYTINGVPFSYLVISAALRNLDPALEEASRLSRAGLWRTLVQVSIPAVRPALFASTLLVVIAGLGQYSVPAVIATTARIDLVTTRIVAMLNRSFPPDLAGAQMLGLVMLVIVVVLWYAQNRISSGGQFVTIGGRASGFARLELGKWKWPARLFTLAFLFVTSVLPLLALLVVSFQPFWTPNVNLATLSLQNYIQVIFIDRMTAAAFSNSMLLSSVGATIAMAIAVIVGIYAAVHQGWISAATDATIKSSAAIPNLVLAVAFLVSFSGAPFYLSGTLLILLLAFVVMYIPPGAIAASAAIAQIGRDLREASYTSGAGEGRTTLRIILPLAMPGFVAGWSIVFVNMMSDLSASALLGGLGNPVIGFTILAIWETGTFGVLAAFSVIMCLVTVVVIALMLGIGRFINKR